MLESKFQANLRKELRTLFPGCVVLKNDANALQGIPDLIILYEDKWAMLEVKRSRNAKQQPNQQYYVDKFGEMSFAAFIHPDNKDEILDKLQRSFQSSREARLSKR